MDAKIDKTRETLEAKIEETRREAGVMMEAIIHEIRALPEGLSALQRQEADRLDASREEAMLNRLPGVDGPLHGECRRPYDAHVGHAP